MKCPHCNQEHPDNFQFCPIKGLPISFMKACNNPNCSSYGQHILPTDAHFCPECGHSLEGENDNNPDKLEFMVNGVSFTMVLVEHGEFLMGSEKEFENPPHIVQITNDYYIGETPVTQALWQTILGYNPSSLIGKDLPVDKVSWDDCQYFIKILNKITDKSFRLLTEAEWEFAARGGKKSRHTQYSGSDILDDVAWYKEKKINQVKTKKPNELGIYDLSGNVSEWCYDWSESYNVNPQIDPKGPFNGTHRVCRGGVLPSNHCRISSRAAFLPEVQFPTFGFRLALTK